jgi:hypothetical protein
MQAIVRKQQERDAENKSTAFRVRGRPVNPEKINRYMKDHPMQSVSANKDKNRDSNISSAGTFPSKAKNSLDSSTHLNM